MQTLSVSKLTTKSQATIPNRVRQKLGLKPGDSVAFKFKDGHIYLQKARPIDRTFARALEATLKDEWSSAHDDKAYADL
jgi:AbrB family looped-hinge helix DNA binding protein